MANLAHPFYGQTVLNNNSTDNHIQQQQQQTQSTLNGNACNISSSTNGVHNAAVPLYDLRQQAVNDHAIMTSLNGQQQQRRLTQDWQGSYPSPSPFGSNQLLNGSTSDPCN